MNDYVENDGYDSANDEEYNVSKEPPTNDSDDEQNLRNNANIPPTDSSTPHPRAVPTSTSSGELVEKRRSRKVNESPEIGRKTKYRRPITVEIDTKGKE